jgi:hypothetical protein
MTCSTIGNSFLSLAAAGSGRAAAAPPLRACA